MIRSEHSHGLDHELQRILRQNDPGKVTPSHIVALQKRIEERIEARVVDEGRRSCAIWGWLPDFRLLDWRIPFPAMAAAALALGLFVGVTALQLTEPYSGNNATVVKNKNLAANYYETFYPLMQNY